MRRKKKSGAGKMIAAVVVVVILLCGIFAIMKNLASPASADNKAGNKEGNSAKAESYYEKPREIKLLFYYPSDEYISYLMTVDEFMFEDEIDCS